MPSALIKYEVLTEGETFNEDPVPAPVPPQLPEYHTQFAPVPRTPPLIISDKDDPAQIVGCKGDMLTAEVETVLTDTWTDKQFVVLHVPSALTQYVVVTSG